MLIYFLFPHLSFLLLKPVPQHEVTKHKEKSNHIIAKAHYVLV